MTLLAVDTATPRLVLGLQLGPRLIGRAVEPESTHNEALALVVRAFWEEHGVRPHDLEAVVIGSGPGAFTGTRVGWAMALGLAEGLGVPAVAVSTLDAIGYADRGSGQDCLALIAARRGRWYGAVYRQGVRQGDWLDLPLEDLVGRCTRWIGPEPPHPTPEGVQVLPLDQWAEGLLALGRRRLERGLLIQPGEGPLYLRPGVDSP